MATASHHSHASSKANFVVEHASPSALCLVRKLQTAPYQSLSPEQLHSVAASNLLSLRPPPHVAHQAVMDFYFAVNGHCGVECEDPSAIDLITVSAHGRGSPGQMDRRPPSHRSNASASATAVAFAAALGNRPGTPDGGMHAQLPQPQSFSPLGTSILPSTTTSSSEDYRLSQIRRNERHVNNATYGKVCAFFNTREGCRRGPYCNFLHMGKSGPNPASCNSGAPGAILPHLS